MLRAIVLLCCLASTCQAGAWPREKGTTFATATIRLGWPQTVVQGLAQGLPVDPEPSSRYMTLYLEHGLTEKLTLGADIGHAVSGEGKTIGFLRYPLGLAPDSRHKLSAEIGLGEIDDDTVIRPGLSYGAGFDIRGVSGWIAVDALAELYPTSGNVDAKMDVTFGLNLQEGHRAILQVQSGQRTGDDPFARFAPSYVMPLGKNRHLEIGGSVSLMGEADVGLLLGLWQSF